VRGGEHLPAPARQQRGWEITAHTHLYSHSASEDSTPKTGLSPASVCSTLRCVHYSAYTPLLSKRVRRPHPEGRACPCERVFHAQVCARQCLHTFTLEARPKTAPRRQGLPLRACVPRSSVCTSAPTHFYSRSASEDRTTTAGLAPASVCFTLRCVHVSAYTPLLSKRVRACPLRAYVPRSGVCTSAPSHLYSRNASEDSPAQGDSVRFGRRDTLDEKLGLRLLRTVEIEGEASVFLEYVLQVREHLEGDRQLGFYVTIVGVCYSACVLVVFGECAAPDENSCMWEG